MKQSVRQNFVWLSGLVLFLSLLLSACGDGTAPGSSGLSSSALLPSPTGPGSIALANQNSAAAQSSATLTVGTTGEAAAAGKKLLKSTLSKLDSQAQGTIAFDLDGEIWVLILPDGTATRLTNDGSSGNSKALSQGFNRNPVWSPDGQLIAFASARAAFNKPGYSGGYDIYSMRPDGGDLKKLTQGDSGLSVEQVPVSWLSSGEILVRQFSHGSPATGAVPPLVLLDPASGQTKPLPISDNDYKYGPFALSGDKALLAYIATKSAPGNQDNFKPDLFLADFPGFGSSKALTNLPFSTSLDVTALVWSPDNQSLAFLENYGDSCGKYRIYSVGKSGNDLRKLLDTFNLIDSAPAPGLSFAPSGKWLAYSTSPCGGGPGKLRLLNTDTGSLALTLTEGNNPSYSPKI